MTKTLRLDGLSAEITYKAIKNVWLRVRDNGQIAVSAPPHATDAELLSFLRAHLPWIRKRLLALEVEKRPGQSSRVMLWGVELPLQIRTGSRSVAITHADSEILLDCPAWPGAAALEKAISTWRGRMLMEKAEPLAKEWLEKFALPPITLACRSMKSRWGSCIPAKRKVTLNSLLTEKPEAALELVIVHELVHFFERGHGKQFHARLERALPDWRQRAVLLKSRQPCPNAGARA